MLGRRARAREWLGRKIKAKEEKCQGKNTFLNRHTGNTS
jgi:hypothetical protein